MQYFIAYGILAIEPAPSATAKSPFRSPSKNFAPVTQWDPQSTCLKWILSKVADWVYGQISHVGLEWVYPCGTHMGCPPLPHLRRPMRPMSIPYGAHMGSPSAAHVPRGPIWPMQTPYGSHVGMFAGLLVFTSSLVAWRLPVLKNKQTRIQTLNAPYSIISS